MPAVVGSHGIADLAWIQLKDRRLEFRRHRAGPDNAKVSTAPCGTGVI